MQSKYFLLATIVLAMILPLARANMLDAIFKRGRKYDAYSCKSWGIKGCAKCCAGLGPDMYVYWKGWNQMGYCVCREIYPEELKGKTPKEAQESIKE